MLQLYLKKILYHFISNHRSRITVTVLEWYYSCTILHPNMLQSPSLYSILPATTSISASHFCWTATIPSPAPHLTCTCYHPYPCTQQNLYLLPPPSLHPTSPGPKKSAYWEILASLLCSSVHLPCMPYVFLSLGQEVGHCLIIDTKSNIIFTNALVHCPFQPYTKQTCFAWPSSLG